MKLLDREVYAGTRPPARLRTRVDEPGGLDRDVLSDAAELARRVASFAAVPSPSSEEPRVVGAVARPRVLARVPERTGGRAGEVHGRVRPGMVGGSRRGVRRDDEVPGRTCLAGEQHDAHRPRDGFDGSRYMGDAFGPPRETVEDMGDEP